MLYVWTLTVDAGTTKDTPKEEKKPIRTGIITKLEIFSPKGCRGYVHTTISHRLMQLLPFNSDSAARPDGVTVTGLYNINITDSQPELILRAWSPSAIYDHAVTYRANILPKEEVTLKDLLSELRTHKPVPPRREEQYPI